MISTLVKLGLTEHEANTYVAALQLGQTTALAISRKTGIKRSTVYDTLDTLTKRGLIELQLKGLKRYFAPTSPDRFDALISEQRKEYDAVLPEMLSLFRANGTKTLIKYYEGMEGVKSAFQQVLREIRNGDYYYVIDNFDSWSDVDLGWLKDYIEMRSRKQLDARIILADTPRNRERKKLDRALNQTTRLVQRPIISDIMVTPQRFLTHNFLSPITTVSIESPEVLETQKNLFLALWDTLPE